MNVICTHIHIIRMCVSSEARAAVGDTAAAPTPAIAEGEAEDSNELEELLLKVQEAGKGANYKELFAVLNRNK